MPDESAIGLHSRGLLRLAAINPSHFFYFSLIFSSAKFSFSGSTIHQVNQAGALGSLWRIDTDHIPKKTRNGCSFTQFSSLRTLILPSDKAHLTMSLRISMTRYIWDRSQSSCVMSEIVSIRPGKETMHLHQPACRFGGLGGSTVIRCRQQST